jgi:two-component system OmpR family response regulator
MMELFGNLKPASARRGPVRTILAVDDSRTSLHVLGRRLAHLGYLTVLSDNGAEALDLITARGFDLVLLDMVMPHMSGVHVLKEVRSCRHTADLPVIMVTGRSDPVAAVEALAAGADDHVAKPYAFEVLAARIERALARARRIADLKRSNATLDARIAARAMELGEAKTALAVTCADRQRLIVSIQALNDEVERLSAGTSVAG